jgi:hypothetical protein
MEVDGDQHGSSGKRKPADGSAEAVCSGSLGDSGASSDKRQRQVTAAAASTDAADVCSSLLPLQPLTAAAVERLQRQGSGQAEQEAAALQALLAEHGPPQQAPVLDYDPLALSAALLPEGEGEQLQRQLQAGSSQPASSLASQLSDLLLLDLRHESGAAATAGSSLLNEGAAHQQPQQEQQQEQQGQCPDPLISHLAEADAAAPIQMLQLEALSRNPLLQQFQERRLAAARAEQTARAVAAAAALRRQLSPEEQAAPQLEEAAGILL